MTGGNSNNKFNGLQEFCWSQALDQWMACNQKSAIALAQNKVVIAFHLRTIARLAAFDDFAAYFAENVQNLIMERGTKLRVGVYNLISIGFANRRFLPLMLEKLLNTLLKLDAGFVKSSSRVADVDFLTKAIFFVLSHCVSSEQTTYFLDDHLVHSLATDLGKVTLEPSLQHELVKITMEHFFKRVLQLETPRFSQFVVFFLLRLPLDPAMIDGFETPA